MGAMISNSMADAAPNTPKAATPTETSAPPSPPDFSVSALKLSADAIKASANEEKVDYLDLPPPLKYEDIQRETLMALKPGKEWI
jgi:mitochondrial import receptor subunit TOM40